MSLARQFVTTPKVEAQRALLAGKPVETNSAAVAAVGKLPAMIKDAAKKLATAASAAEILDVIDTTSLAYDASKRAGRIAKAKGAHDTVVAAAHRAQADALDIEAAAKRRLADEYDGAQERGEVAARSDNLKRGPEVPRQNIGKATAADAELSRKQVHEARRVRNAEKAQPGVISEALDQAIVDGKEPTRAVVNEAVSKALGETKPIDARTDAERDADTLQYAWDRACEQGRAMFLARNDLQFQAKASEDNGATGTTMCLADSATGDASRPSVGGDTDAPLFQSTAPAVEAVAANPVPKPPKAATAEVSNPPPTSSPEADKAGEPQDRNEPVSGSSATSFDNPRCQKRDTCPFAHDRDACHDCLMAWSKRPKDEQVRLWAEANEVARAA